MWLVCLPALQGTSRQSFQKFWNEECMCVGRWHLECAWIPTAKSQSLVLRNPKISVLQISGILLIADRAHSPRVESRILSLSVALWFVVFVLVYLLATATSKHKQNNARVWMDGGTTVWTGGGVCVPWSSPRSLSITFTC